MDDTPWLTPAQLRSWMNFVAVVELLPGVLDGQLQRDSDLSHFEYFVLAVLSEAPTRTLRMTALSERTNSTLPRLSHVVARLEKRGFVDRKPCAEDRRATNASLTETGWHKVVTTAPGHVSTVRHHVIDPLSPAQIEQLGVIAEAMLRVLDPENRLHVNVGAQSRRTVEP